MSEQISISEHQHMLVQIGVNFTTIQKIMKISDKQFEKQNGDENFHFVIYDFDQKIERNSEKREIIYSSEPRDVKAHGCCYELKKSGLVIYWN